MTIYSGPTKSNADLTEVEYDGGEVTDPGCCGPVIAGTSPQFWAPGEERKGDKGWSQDVWGVFQSLSQITKDTTPGGPESCH